MEDWSETGASYTESLTTWIWEYLPDVSAPPASDAETNVVQVVEFSLNPGGEDALAHTLAKFREAADAVAPNLRFAWYAVLAGPQGTTHFIVLPVESFGEFDLDVPEPPEILSQHYGETEARALFDMFNEAMTFKQTRVWALRRDLSYGLD